MCQDEDENEPEDEFFRSFRIKTVTNEPGPQYYYTLKDRFVRHAQVPEQTKALVFVFVSFSSWHMNRLLQEEYTISLKVGMWQLPSRERIIPGRGKKGLVYFYL